MAEWTDIDERWSALVEGNLTDEEKRALIEYLAWWSARKDGQDD